MNPKNNLLGFSAEPQKENPRKCSKSGWVRYFSPCDHRLKKAIFGLLCCLFWAANLSLFPLEAQGEAQNNLYEEGRKAFEAKEYERAKELLLQALQQNDDEPEIKAQQFYTLGQVFEKLEDEAMALQSYGQSIELTPQNWKAYYAYAQIAVAQDNPRLAWQIYTRIIELDQKNARAYSLRADLLLPYVAFLALLDYDKAIENTQDSRNLGRLYLQRGQANIAQHRYVDAENDFLRALKQKLEKTQLGTAYTGLGQSQLRQQKFSRAKNALLRAIRYERENPYIYIYLGAIETAKGSRKQAQKYFDKAFALNPEISELYRKRALFAWQAGRIQEAETDYNRAIELAPEDFEVYLLRGRFYQNLGRYENVLVDYNKKALADYNQGIKYLDPNLFRKREGETLDETQLLLIFQHRGAVQRQLGEYKQALESYQTLLERNVENANVYIGIGNTKVSIGNYEEALANYEKAMEFSPVKGPGSAQPLYLMGSTKAQLGRLQEGFDDVTEALKREPRNAAAHYFQSLLYAQKKDYRKAKASLKKAMRYERSNPKYIYALALLQYQHTDYNQALKQLSAIIKRYPGYNSAYSLRAQVYFLLDNTDDALADTALALEREPQNAELYILQAALHQSQKQHDLALTDYQLGLSALPKSAALYRARARLYQTLGQSQKALEDINKAFALDPEGTETGLLLYGEPEEGIAHLEYEP